MTEKTILYIEAANDMIGRLFSALIIAVVLIAFSVVVLRYGFGIGRAWIAELAVWTHSFAFMCAAGFAFRRDGHVRVDVIYRPASERTKALINLAGIVVLLIPMLLVIWYYSFSYVRISWLRLESSGASGGLPGLFILKSAILLFCVTLGLQAMAIALRSLLVLQGRRESVFDVERAGEAIHGS